MRKLLFMLAVVGFLATPTMAGLVDIQTSPAIGPVKGDPSGGGGPRDPTSDGFNAVVTAFNADGDMAFLDTGGPMGDASYVYGDRTHMGNNNNLVTWDTSTPTDVTLGLNVNNFLTFIAPGFTINGLPATGIQFEFGELNAGSDTIDPGLTPSFIVLSAEWNLIDSTGASVIGGPQSLSVDTHGGTGVSFVAEADAGGQDLGDLAIIRADFTIDLQAIPEPTTLGLLALGAFALLRRRRRQRSCAVV